MGANADAHGIKRFGQAANLVGAACVFHGCVVLTTPHPLGRSYQRTQRGGYTPGRNHAAHAKQHNPQGSDPRQSHLCLAKWRDDFVKRAQQHGAHFARLFSGWRSSLYSSLRARACARANIELDVARHQCVAINHQLCHVAHIVLQRLQGVGRQRADHHPVGFARSVADKR